MILLDAHNNGEGNGAPTSSEHDIDILAQPDGVAQTGTETQVETVETTEQPAPPTGLTKDDITNILRDVMPPPVQPAPAAQPQLSQEEYDRLFNVWKPQTALLKDLRSEDEAVQMKALVELRDGLVRQSSTIAEARLQHLLGELRTKDITPLQSFIQEQQNQALQTEFYTKNKDLEPYSEIVDAVSTKVFADGKKHGKEEAFKLAADASRDVINRMLAAKGGQPLAKPAAKRQMSTSLVGGGQGGRSTSGGNGRKPGMAIFDETEG